MIDRVPAATSKAAWYGLVVGLLAFLPAGCASPPDGLFPPRAGQPARTIYVVGHGWHAGIVVRSADVPPGVWPQRADFPRAEYLEIGWGDRDFYMTPGAHLGITLKAALVPTESVLHVVGFRASVEEAFPLSTVIRIDLSEAGLHRLGRFLEDSYALDEGGRSRPLGPSLYGRGQFYLARESYHLFNTCNAWTARALREAGCPILPAANLLVGSLMSSLAKCGSVIRAGPALERPG